jgi:hypothetical protein
VVHVPIVILGEEPSHFQGLLVQIHKRLQAFARLGKNKSLHISAAEIYIVHGSPLNKRDLERCRVQQAYGVVLFGDGLSDEDGGDDSVTLDRHVLLSAFQLESLLRHELYGEVMTLVDLKSETNMYLLRQQVRERSRTRDSMRRSLSGCVKDHYPDDGRNDHAMVSLAASKVNAPTRRQPRPVADRDIATAEACPIFAAGRICSQVGQGGAAQH